MPKLVARLVETDEVWSELERDDDPVLYDEWVEKTPDGWTNGMVYVRVVPKAPEEDPGKD